MSWLRWGALRQLTEKLQTIKWDLTDTFESMGRPTIVSLQRGKELGEKFAKMLMV
jgi:hypothetical protein